MESRRGKNLGDPRQGFRPQIPPIPRSLQEQETPQQIETPIYINTQQPLSTPQQQPLTPQQQRSPRIPKPPPPPSHLTERADVSALTGAEEPLAIVQKSPPRKGPPPRPVAMPERRVQKQSQPFIERQKETTFSPPQISQQLGAKHFQQQRRAGDEQKANKQQPLRATPANTQDSTWKRNHFNYPTHSLGCSCLSDIEEYRNTEIIERLAKERYGPGIFVVGSTLKEIREFWKFIGYEVVNSIETPHVVGKAKVDVGCKTYRNGSQADDETVKSKINSNNLQLSKPKPVTLQVPKMQGFHIGGSTGLSADPGFFNLAEGAGIEAEKGFNSSQGFHQVENEESLSQGYMFKESLKVPPGRNVQAKITTWAVTYEANTITKFSVDAYATLPVLYRSRMARLLGGCFISTGYLTAIDLFADEDNFQFDSMENTVTFTRSGKVSYLGEEVDIKKCDTKIPTSFDDM